MKTRTEMLREKYLTTLGLLGEISFRWKERKIGTIESILQNLIFGRIETLYLEELGAHKEAKETFEKIIETHKDRAIEKEYVPTTSLEHTLGQLGRIKWIYQNSGRICEGEELLREIATSPEITAEAIMGLLQLKYQPGAMEELEKGTKRAVDFNQYWNSEETRKTRKAQIIDEAIGKGIEKAIAEVELVKSETPEYEKALTTIEYIGQFLIENRTLIYTRKLIEKGFHKMAGRMLEDNISYEKALKEYVLSGEKQKIKELALKARKRGRLETAIKAYTLVGEIEEMTSIQEKITLVKSEFKDELTRRVKEDYFAWGENPDYCPGCAFERVVEETIIYFCKKVGESGIDGAYLSEEIIQVMESPLVQCTRTKYLEPYQYLGEYTTMKESLLRTKKELEEKKAELATI